MPYAHKSEGGNAQHQQHQQDNQYNKSLFMLAAVAVHRISIITRLLWICIGARGTSTTRLAPPIPMVVCTYMQLSQTIKEYYYQHLPELTEHKQFHFCTRLGAWEGDSRALDHLKKLKTSFVPDPYSPEAMSKELEHILTSPPAVTANAQNLREAYFEKYPTLRGIDNALFRVRHMLAVYGIDTRTLLTQAVPLEQLQKLKSDLLADPQAFCVLSTYAVNFLYLLERVVLEHDDPASIDIAYLYKLGERYDLTDRQLLQLYIYLYTHCIIGETNFYTRRIPQALLPNYTRMIAALETVIGQHFDDINLDNKLEFLVCCQIVGVPSQIAGRIYVECDASLSDEGHFLVDKHNANVQPDRTDISASEHRNVLFIMSHTPYNPHPTLVD